MAQPEHGQVYQASDQKWYRWPEPTAYDSEEAARVAAPAPAKVKQKRAGFLPGWRKFTYVILAFNVLMLVWVIAGIASSSGNATDCGSLSQETCNAAEDVGTGIAVFGVVVLWALVDVILGVVWMVTRGSKRACPVCGNSVKKGMVVCPSCGFDYRRQLQGASV
jgi:hypothetical protein